MFEAIFALPLTDRVERIRAHIAQHPVARALDIYNDPEYPRYYSGDRWVTQALLDGWVKYRKSHTTLLRRARAEAHALYMSEPVIDPESLIAGELDLHDLVPEEKAKLFAESEKFQNYAPFLQHGRPDHICLDFPKLLKVGVNGLLAEIRERRAALDLNDPATIAENVEKDEFYTCCEIELEALLDYARRYAEKAEAMAELPENAAHADNLRAVAATLRKVPAEPAETFREAVQSVHFYVFNLFGLYPGGHPDRYLLEYYERDLAKGTLTPAFAQELIDNYCLLFSTYVFSRAANSIMLGGSEADGTPVANALTAHFLRSISHVRRPDPNYSFAVSDDTPAELVEFALAQIRDGWSHPSFYNDKGIAKGLQAYGVAPEDSHCFINTTCAELTICGKTDAWTTTPYFSTVDILHDVLHSGETFRSVDEVLAAFRKAAEALLEHARRTYNLQYLEAKRNGVEPFRVSCLIQDCLARGRTIWNGGAVYNPMMPTFVGMSNVTEALSAYDRLVFTGKEYTQDELTAIVDADYRNHEELRTRIIRTFPHYGNAIPEIDGIMQKIMAILDEICRGKFNYRGGRIVPGAFAYMWHTTDYATRLPSADGRKTGDALASHPGPLNGFDRQGPTAGLYSSSVWPQTRFPGGITMNVRFSKKMMQGEGLSKIRALILGFFARGGQQLQFNCVDTETLKDAQKKPDAYGDLLVRIGGYSEFFTRLAPEIQQDVITRLEAE